MTRASFWNLATIDSSVSQLEDNTLIATLRFSFSVTGHENDAHTTATELTNELVFPSGRFGDLLRILAQVSASRSTCGLG